MTDKLSKEPLTDQERHEFLELSPDVQDMVLELADWLSADVSDEELAGRYDTLTGELQRWLDGGIGVRENDHLLEEAIEILEQSRRKLLAS